MSNQMQPLALPSTVAEEINRLHAEALSSASESRNALCTGLVAAWKAGQLLITEKRAVRRTMGSGAWQLWLMRHFSGTPRTAQRYMLLAKNVPDVSLLNGMSLRQVYFRLGIATEPKSAPSGVVIGQLPRHTVLATRLLGVLKAKPNLLATDVQESFRQDLRPLYERLRLLFERPAR